MSSVYHTPVLNNTEAVTRKEVIARYLLESGTGFVGTATGGSASTIIGDRLDSTGYNAEDLIGAWVRISAAGGAAPEGEIRKITDYAPGSGMITVDPEFTSAVSSSDEYEIHKLVHPQDMLDYVTNIITHETYLPVWSTLSNIEDFDMEYSGKELWSESGGGTITKVSAAGEALAGARSLKFVASADSDYVYPANNPYVVPNRTYMFSCLIQVTDATSAQIKLLGTGEVLLKTINITNDVVPVRVITEVTAGDGIDLILPTFFAIGGNRTITIDDVVLYGIGDRDILLPNWIRHPDQVKGVFRMRRGAIQHIDSDQYTRELIGSIDPVWDIQDSPHGKGSRLSLVSRTRTISEPLFINAVKNEEDYSSDSDTKNIDSNYMNAALCYKAFENMSSEPASGTISMDWVERRRRYWEDKYNKERRRQGQRLAQTLSPYMPDVYVDPIMEYPRPFNSQRL